MTPPIKDISPEKINRILQEPEVDEFAKASFKAMHRKLRRKARQQAQYFNCRQLGELVGKHENTIRREFEKEKEGVRKRPFSGRNRKTYITMLISRAAAKRHYPDLDI